MLSDESYVGRGQTYAKHFFLEKYLERVAYNILSFRREFVYVDGFSGPWRSGAEKLEDTSFSIAVTQLRKAMYGCKERDRRIRCIFVERDSDSFSELKRFAASVTDIPCECINAGLEQAVPEVVRSIGNEFSFTFIDPTGWTGFGMEAIAPILGLPGEILINFMFTEVNRFVHHSKSNIRETMDPLFGDSAWRMEVSSRVEEGATREDAITQIYCERLKTRGKFAYVTATPILFETRDRTYFYLVYGTRHRKGLIEFRKAEEKLTPEQERVRLGAKMRVKEEKTGMPDLFADAIVAPTSNFGALAKVIKRHREIAEQMIVSRLQSAKTIKFMDLDNLMELSFVSEKVLVDLVKHLEYKGILTFDRNSSRQQRPYPDSILRWQGNNIRPL